MRFATQNEKWHHRTRDSGIVGGGWWPWEHVPTTTGEVCGGAMAQAIVQRQWRPHLPSASETDRTMRSLYYMKSEVNSLKVHAQVCISSAGAGQQHGRRLMFAPQQLEVLRFDPPTLGKVGQEL